MDAIKEAVGDDITTLNEEIKRFQAQQAAARAPAKPSESEIKASEMEAALNGILRSLQDNNPVTADGLARTTASERRRERRRARLRRVGADPHDALAAREALRIAPSKVTSGDWRILCQLAEGYSYAEVAAQTGSSTGSLRVRVLRCRRRLAA